MAEKAAVILLVACVELLTAKTSPSSCTIDTNFDYSQLITERRNNYCRNNVTFKIDCPLKRNIGYVSYSLPIHDGNSMKVCYNDRIILHISRSSENETVPVFSGINLTDIKLTELYLEGLGISKIRNTAFVLQERIKVVSLKRNELSRVEEGLFGYLPELEVLDLSENRLTVIEWEDFQRAPLQELYLNKNQLSHIPNFFSDITFLDMSHNSLSEINPGVVFKTKVLNVSNNRIGHINMSSFPRIEVLNIANNNIQKRLEFGLYSQNLVELYLSNTSLTSISSHSFRNLSKLSVLDVSDNRLYGFASGTFDHFENLTSLNISYNKLETLPVYIFHRMRSLTGLYVQGNTLSDLDVSDLLEHSPKLKFLDLQYNGWTCYDLLYILRKLHDHNISVKQGTIIDDANISGIRCYDGTNVKNDIPKKALDAIEKLHVDILNNSALLEKLMKSSLTVTLSTSATDPVNTSIVIFIAVLLTVMTFFMAIHLYATFFTPKCHWSENSELTHSVNSTSENIYCEP